MGNRGSTRRRPRMRFRFSFEFEFFCKQAMMSNLGSMPDSVLMCKSTQHPGTDKLMVGVFYSASSNGASEHTDSIFNDLAEKYKDVVTFVRMNVDEMADAVPQFGIQTMPTCILVKDGQEVDRLVGGDSKELERKIEKLISLESVPVIIN